MFLYTLMMFMFMCLVDSVRTKDITMFDTFFNLFWSIGYTLVLYRIWGYW